MAIATIIDIIFIVLTVTSPITYTSASTARTHSVWALSKIRAADRNNV